MYTYPFLFESGYLGSMLLGCLLHTILLPFLWERAVVANDLLLSSDLLLNQRPFSLKWISKATKRSNSPPICNSGHPQGGVGPFPSGSFPASDQGQEVYTPPWEPSKINWKCLATFLRKFSSDRLTWWGALLSYLRTRPEVCSLQVLNIGGKAHSLGPPGLLDVWASCLGRWQDGSSTNPCFSVSWETFPSSPLGGGHLHGFSLASTGSHPVEVPLRQRLVMSSRGPQ